MARCASWTSTRARPRRPPSATVDPSATRFQPGRAHGGQRRRATAADRVGRRASATAAETLSGHAGGISALDHHDGSDAYSAASDGEVLMWDLAGDRRLGRPFDIPPGSARVLTLALRR